MGTSHKMEKIRKSTFPLVRCAKLRENPENQGFTFFGFLPPYLGVSDSLTYFKLLDLKKSIAS